MAQEDDFLIGTEFVARAFQKYLRGAVVRFYLDEGGVVVRAAVLRVGNYVVNFDVEIPDGEEGIRLRVKDVSDAK